MKLTDLITPEHIKAAYRKYEGLSLDELRGAVDPHIEELLPIASVVALHCYGAEFAMTMTAISIVDLAIREATSGRKQ